VTSPQGNPARREPLLWLQLLGLAALPLEAAALLLVLAGADPGPLPGLERLFCWALGAAGPAVLLWRLPPDLWSLLLLQVPLKGRRPDQLRLSALQGALPLRLLAAAGAPLLCRTVLGGKAVNEARHWNRDHQEDHRGHHEWREVKVRRLQDLRLLEGFNDTENRDKRRILLEADEVIEEWWHYATERLRQHDVAQRLEACQAECTCRALLRRVNGFNAGAVDLAHVGAVDQHQCHERPEERLARHARET